MKSLFVPFLALIVVAGCSDRQVAVDTPMAAASEMKPAGPVGPPLPMIEHAKITDLPLADADEQLPLQLSGGQTVVGTAVSNEAGEMVGMSFLVGNYHYASRGPITLEVCVRSECRTSIIDTASTIDNEMLAFPLGSPLNVIEGEEIAFKLTREAGANEFAIWTYPAVEGAGRLDSPDMAFRNRTARIQLLWN